MEFRFSFEVQVHISCLKNGCIYSAFHKDEQNTFKTILMTKDTKMFGALIFLMMMVPGLARERASELTELKVNECLGEIMVLGPFSSHLMKCEDLTKLNIPHPILVGQNNRMFLFKTQTRCPILPYQSAMYNKCWTIWHDLVLGSLASILILYIYNVIRWYRKSVSHVNSSQIVPLKGIIKSAVEEDDRPFMHARIPRKKLLKMLLMALCFQKVDSCTNSVTRFQAARDTWSFCCPASFSVCSNTSVYDIHITPTVFNLGYLYTNYEFKTITSNTVTEGSFSRTYGLRSTKLMETSFDYNLQNPEDSKRNACFEGGDYGWTDRSAKTCFDYYYEITNGYQIYDFISEQQTAKINSTMDDCQVLLMESVIRPLMASRKLVMSFGHHFICSDYEIFKMNEVMARFHTVEGAAMEGDLTVPPQKYRFDMNYNIILERGVVKEPLSSCIKLPGTYEGHYVEFDTPNFGLKVSPSPQTLVSVSCPFKWMPQVAEGDCHVTSVSQVSAPWDMREDTPIIKTSKDEGSILIKVECIELSLTLECGKIYTVPLTAKSGCKVGGLEVVNQELSAFFSSMHEHLEQTAITSSGQDNLDYIRLGLYVLVGFLILGFLKILTSFFD